MLTGQYINLSKDAIDVLQTRKVNREQAYNTYPTSFDDEIYSMQEIRNVSNHVLNELKFGKGYSIVSISEAVLTDSYDIRIAFWNLFTCFAKPLSQFNNGNFLQNVQKSDEPPPPRCSYSMSDKVAQIHTDGSYLYNESPHFIGLICLSQAEFGGEEYNGYFTFK